MTAVTIWLVCGVVGLILELFLPGLVIIFFGCGALVTGITKWIFTSMPIELQIVIFIVSSLVLLLVFRNILRRKWFNTKPQEVEDELADEYVGKVALAIADFSKGHGEVEFRGSKWDAFSDDEIKSGDEVVIVSRESIKLKVVKN